MILGGRRWCTVPIQSPGRSARVARFSGRASHSVSKRPIWLAEAARPIGAPPPTTQRIAGSRHNRSASFTVLVAGKPPEYRLPQQPDQQVPSILAGARLGQSMAAARRQSENVVQFAVGEQSAIGGDHRTAKLKHQPAVEIEPRASLFDSPVGSAIAAPSDVI